MGERVGIGLAGQNNAYAYLKGVDGQEPPLNHYKADDYREERREERKTERVRKKEVERVRKRKRWGGGGLIIIN